MKRARVLASLAAPPALLLAPSPALAQSIDDSVVVTQDPASPSEEPPRRGFTYALEAGLLYRQLYGVSIVGTEIDASFGGRTRYLDVYGTLDVVLGSTKEGLFTSRIAIGPTLMFPVGKRVRLGVEPRLGFLAIRRITKNDIIGSFGAGLHAVATVDVFRTGATSAFYLGLRVGGDTFFNAAPTAAFWGGTLLVGFRD